MEMRLQLHALAALPSGKKHLYLLNMRMVGSQSQSGCFGEEKSLLSLLGFKLWIIQPIA